MTIVVTGARGKIGRALMPSLPDVPVRALGRTSSPQFDWAEQATWDGALEGVEQLFLLVPGGDDGHRDVSSEVANATAFVDRAVNAGAERIVMLSALGVNQAPDDVPMRALELHVQASAPSWTIVRPNWFFQNFTDGPLADLITAGDGQLRAPLEQAQVSYVDAVDVGQVCAAALLDNGHHEQAYDLTGPVALNPDEVADAFARGSSHVAGSAWSYRHLDEAVFRTEVKDLGWDDAYIDTVCGLFAMMRAGWAAHVTDDVERVLGRPARSLEDFAAGRQRLGRA